MLLSAEYFCCRCAQAATPPLPAAPAAEAEDAAGEAGVVRTRTYDLLISYNLRHDVPRFWLVGYSENRTPLSEMEVSTALREMPWSGVIPSPATTCSSDFSRSAPAAPTGSTTALCLLASTRPPILRPLSHAALPTPGVQVMEDVISDYYNYRDRDTVTVEAHPHRAEGGRVVSVHPCRHAAVMKKLAGLVAGEGKEFSVEQ